MQKQAANRLAKFITSLSSKGFAPKQYIEQLTGLQNDIKGYNKQLRSLTGADGILRSPETSYHLPHNPLARKIVLANETTGAADSYGRPSAGLLHSNNNYDLDVPLRNQYGTLNINGNPVHIGNVNLLPGVHGSSWAENFHNGQKAEGAVIAMDSNMRSRNFGRKSWADNKRLPILEHEFGHVFMGQGNPETRNRIARRLAVEMSKAQRQGWKIPQDQESLEELAATYSAQQLRGNKSGIMRQLGNNNYDRMLNYYNGLSPQMLHSMDHLKLNYGRPIAAPNTAPQNFNFKKDQIVQKIVDVLNKRHINPAQITPQNIKGLLQDSVWLGGIRIPISALLPATGLDAFGLYKLLTTD